MKKIIRGRKYDTDSAKFIAQVWANGTSVRDCEYWEETLFRKKTGEFFLYCAGGANSRYGHWEGSNGYSGEEIQPLSYAQAKTWAEENMSADEYEAEFGKVVDDGSTEYMTLAVPTAVATQLRRMSSAQNKTVGKIIAELIKEENI